MEERPGEEAAPAPSRAAGAGGDDLPERALARVDPARFTLLELMALAIDERGAPMSYEALRERIAPLVKDGRSTSLVSFKRAWHGSPPLRKNVRGALEIVREGERDLWDLLVWKVRSHLGLVPARPSQAPAPRASCAKPAPGAPATWDELREAFPSLPPGLSTGRRLALVLEAAGAPLTEDELAARLGELGMRLFPGSARTCSFNRHSAVHRLEDGRFSVDPAHPALAEARAALRRELERQRPAAERRQAHAEWMQRDQAERFAKRRRQQERWESARKRFLRTSWQGDRLVLALLLDPDTLEFTEASDEASLAAELRDAGALLALDPLSELERLSLDARDRMLVDLRPPVKTRRLNRAGRTLAITPDLVMRGTLNRPRALASARELAAHARAGRIDRLRRRLVSDLKSLHALFEYGWQHGYVRLRWGFLDELLPVHWKPFDRHGLRDVLASAMVAVRVRSAHAMRLW